VECYPGCSLASKNDCAYRMKEVIAPPQLFLRFFRWFCHPKLLKYIEGDLMELYDEQLRVNGERKADVEFILNVLLLFRPGIIRPVGELKNINSSGMYRSYFKIGWRNLMRNKGYSFINLGGLSFGMAVAMLIGLWIYDEWSYNKSFNNYDRIAQVIQNTTNNGEIETWTNVPFPLGEELRNSFGSDFKFVSMSSGIGDHILALGEKILTSSGAYLEPQALDILSVSMIKGTYTGLNDLHSIFLSESTAASFFGNTDPMDKILKMDNSLDVKVAGVYQDFPENSSFAEITFIVPWALFVESQGLMQSTNPWRCNCYQSYVQIADNTDMESVSAKIQDAKLKKVNEDELIHNPQLFLHPMSRWHLYSEYRNGKNAGGRIQYVQLFALIGIFVLLLACINFMNLSTARSEKRAKEVSIRKSIGSRRSQLIYQFFTESLLVVGFALLLSLVLVQLALPFFNDVAGKSISIPLGNPAFWLISMLFIVACGLIAGSYPALYLSSFQPVKVLKGTFRAGKLAAVPRKVLVVVQFTVSVTLIIGTIVVFQQVQFAMDRPVGYDREGLVSMTMITLDVHNHFDAIRNELVNAGVIADMAESGGPVTQVWGTNSGFDWNGKDPSLAVDFPNTSVSYDYGKTVGWRFEAGRDFSRDHLSDSAAFVVNETAVKFMGLKDPIGQIVTWDERPYTIVGVIRDMIVESPYQPVRPSIFNLSGNAENIVILRINPNSGAGSALKKIEEVFKKYNPSQPFSYQFVDDEYAKKFGNEKRIGKLSSFFSVLAIFISCLGIFALSSFTAEQRTKEIGIRKVLGASVTSLWQMLSKDFVILIAISCAISIPLSIVFMHGWLQQYEYHTSVSWSILAVVSLGALAITLLTVSYQALKTAMINPVNSLKSE